MAEIKDSSQFRFGGEFAPGNSKRKRVRVLNVIQSKNIQSPITKLNIQPKEQLGFEDADIRKEITSLTYAKEGIIIGAPAQNGYGTTLEQLQKYAIFFKRPAKNHATRYSYYLRTDVPVSKKINGYNSPRILEAGTCVTIRPEDREKIPSELVPEVEQEIRKQEQTPKLLKNLLREAFHQRVG